MSHPAVPRQAQGAFLARHVDPQSSGSGLTYGKSSLLLGRVSYVTYIARQADIAAFHQLVCYAHGDREGNGRAGLRWWIGSGAMGQAARVMTDL